MSVPPIASRFVASIFANVLRGALSFLTAIIIARNLGPEKYGNFSFLLGSFVALHSLITLGTTGAFQTFISQKERGRKFVLCYMSWQLVQFLLVMFVIGLLLPEKWLNQIWLNQEKSLVLLAFAAIFMQQQVWRTFVYIGEARRLTYKVQALNVVVAGGHFLLVVACWIMNWLSVQLVFSLILFEYLFFITIAKQILFVSFPVEDSFNGKSVLREYVQYCSPLIVGAVLSFGYLFADRWMLQSFGGSKEQGFYEVGYRLGAVTLLITAALLNIFWKEIAEAKEQGNWQLMGKLYHKVSRSLFTVGAVFAGFMIPWSEEILRLMLGKSYVQGAPVLVAMLCFSVFNSVAQVNSSMLLATSKTKAHLVLGSILMVINFPLTYFLLAPEKFSLSGLEMGSFGLALKMVLHIILHVNLFSWWISRDNGWKFDWLYQWVGLSGAILLGFISFELSTLLSDLMSANLFIKGGFSLVLYIAFSSVMIFRMPWLIGASRQEIVARLQGIKLSWNR